MLAKLERLGSLRGGWGRAMAGSFAFPPEALLGFWHGFVSEPSLLRFFRLWRGFGGGGILPVLEFRKGLLRGFGRRVFELLERGQRFLRVLRTMQAAIQKAKLIPGLLQNLRI